MGHVVHHAIVVTSWDATLIDAARKKAVTLGASVSPLIKSAVNDDYSFLIGPDGSKSGWDESDNGDAQRNAWVKWAHRKRYEDGSSSLCWVEVAYGSDDRSALVTRSEWQSSAAVASLATPETNPEIAARPSEPHE